MKIKNELISIKIGEKQYDFNNLILDEYLKRFAKRQLDNNNLEAYKNSIFLRCCLIKFDTPLDFTNSSELKNQDFDICFMSGLKYTQNISKNTIIAEYIYNSDDVYDYKINSIRKIQEFYNRKITAIGFNIVWMPYDFNNSGSYKFPVCAVLDTSNYSIYTQQNQEFCVIRKDIISSDSLFFSNNIEKVPGPVHLCPQGVPQIIYQPNIYADDEQTIGTSFNNNGYGILYSVGLSSYPDYIDKEFIIGTDLEANINETEININGLENYLATDNSLFCGKELYADSSLYPVKTNYKYVIFKYKVWQIVHSGSYDNVISTPTDTGYYYYQAIPIEKIGKSNLKIKYERG